MPAPRLRAHRTRDRLALTPAQELVVRLTGRPAAAMAALEAIDAEMVAQGRKLPALYVSGAIRAAGFPETRDRALWLMSQAQLTRHSARVLAPRVDAEWRR